ncbi:MAG: alanine racemase [Thermoleophilaceae bacterium]|jgi:alanine racemase|nr:alanine racemase [Thermoleophilaceae bacterium]
MPEGPERALARVDLGAVERNCSALKAVAGDSALCAVVKADGYGHGHAAVARAAVAGGATWLAVATADEARALRKQGIEERLLVMGALTPADLDTALAANADVVAWTGEFLDWLDTRGGGPRVHVKLDSGMGRLGTADPDEARALCRRVADTERLELAGFMTHFATADAEGDEYLGRQLERFAPLAAEMSEAHPGLVVHAANSAATMREPRAHFGMVRCGVAIYGLDPFGRDPAGRGLDPALSLESYVAAVKRFEPGDSAGYGRRFIAQRPTWLAVLPIGYGDGWRRGLTNNADVLVRGRRHPLVGTVSMDNITIDLGPETDVTPGERAVLIGAQGGDRILCEEVARRLDTINYEITCGLTQRVRRRHLAA